MGKREVRYKRKKGDTSFDLGKYIKQLEAVGKDESTMSAVDTLETFENMITENPKAYPYHKTYWCLYQHLRPDVTGGFCAILNIRGMEKKRKHSAVTQQCDLDYLKSLNGRSAKALLKAIEKYPTLAIGWFRLPEARLMRAMNITRHTEARYIDTLRNEGLLLTIVCGMPRKRWVRVNYKMLFDLLNKEEDDIEFVDEEDR